MNSADSPESLSKTVEFETLVEHFVGHFVEIWAVLEHGATRCATNVLGTGSI
jgi:hypothetical protein